MNEDRRDPRIAMALELLIQALGESGSTPQAGSPAGPRWMPPDPWLTSATDILVPWTPELIDATAPQPDRNPWTIGPVSSDAWDRYFRPPAPGHEVSAASLSGTAPIEIPVGSIAPGATASPPNHIDDEAARLATDSLYGFVHALERCDVDGAMKFVADDYHALEGDREIDRVALQHELESFIDPRRDGELEISLARVPEPLAHPIGILIEVLLQTEFEPASGGPAESSLIERIAVISETSAGTWQISALADLER